MKWKNFGRNKGFGRGKLGGKVGNKRRFVVDD